MTADLEACAREPIHIPGAIQPHGILLALKEPELRILQVSRNTPALLGMTAQDLLGRTLAEMVNQSELSELNSAIAKEKLAQASPLPLTIGGTTFDSVVHRHDGVLIAELEPAPAAPLNSGRQHRHLQRFLGEMQHAATLADLYAVAARAVSEFTGYERVMVYRFDADWHGEVVAETLTGDVDSYMGHHFPASDIPEQARALYARSFLRIIPASDYTPAPLEPEMNPLTGHPLDLSFSMLRSVSPVHLEYLRNMSVGASMSISLIVEGKLWGLIACHHRTARPLPYAVRSMCELFGQMASREIAAKQEAQRLLERAEVNTIQTRFFEAIAREQNVADALLRYTPTLLEFLNTSGAAICLGEQTQIVGSGIPKDHIGPLLEWLQRQHHQEPVYATDSLGKAWPPAEQFQETASGLLAVKLSRLEPHFVLWFRPEVKRTVTWAGNPEKPVEPGLRLHPRKSFAAWQQIVAGHSLPWKAAEIQGAFELRHALNALVIRRTERLVRLNHELERKNSDLNSFAYVASHDLKEPLRGIFHFARFLREDHAQGLGPDGLRQVDTIAALASHTNDLLAALARFSELGRIELARRDTDLETVIDEVLVAHGVLISEAQAEIRRPRPLPKERCDTVLIREVFGNLVANAVKYNDKPEKWVEINFREPAGDEESRGPVFTVRDNGIGIRERNFESVFEMFRRLNKEKYGAGTGAGLAIVKSIVERHGGRIWVESTLGEGSTFCFTLR